MASWKRIIKIVTRDIENIQTSAVFLDKLKMGAAIEGANVVSKVRRTLYYAGRRMKRKNN